MKTELASLFLLLATQVSHAEVKRVDMAEAMRTCTDVVSDDCIVRYFKDTLEASEIRGKLVYQNYCTLCHGVEGKGDGRAARLHTPPPANLVASRVNREYLALIIRRGGEAMGRGKGMPPWGEQLTDEQINDVLNFLLSIRQ